uniref:Uncharacterized protein n=1 Tax=Anguilla anguilla TaxID=7936 RepID=A0A0E9SK22_ANGAN
MSLFLPDSIMGVWHRDQCA